MATSHVTPIDRYRTPKLADLIEAFLTSKGRTLSVRSTKTTIRAYRQDLARFLQTFAGIEPASIAPAAVETYLNDMTKPDGSPMAPATINRHHATLCSFFTWLVDQGSVEKSPMKAIRKVRAPDAPPGALSEAVCAQVIERAKAAGLREHALTVLMLTTGLRIAEALALNIEDLHMEDLAISVRHGKGDKPRRVFMTVEARAVMKRYLKEHPDRHAHSPVLRSNRGRLSYPRAAAIFAQVTAGLTNGDGSPLHLHQLRHTFATDQLNRGMNPVHLATVTGHSDLRTLSRYTKAAQEAAAEAEFRRHNR